MKLILLSMFVAGALVLYIEAVNADLGDELFKLLPSDGAAGDQFGHSIGTDNGIVAVGARFDADNGSASGSAYVFDASTGAQIAKLLPSDGAEGDEFGYSIDIDIDNGIVAVGAYLDDDNGWDSGSAYLFDASTGAQIAKLLPSDGTEGDWFGYSIAIDNGVVAVGALFDDDNGWESGSVYLFDASTGAQIAKLLASDGAEGDEFGYSIAIDNGIVAVGAVDDLHGSAFGSAYLFDASTGAQLFKLLPSDGAMNDGFGNSIAIANGIVAIGAYKEYGINSGSAYLFDASTGVQLFKLLPSDGAARDRFGYSIAIDNGIVAVGAYLDDDNGINSGSAYLFDASTGAQIAKLLTSDGATDDWFGYSIAIDNGIVAVGVIYDDDNGTDSGSAYLFDAESSNGTTATLTSFSIDTGVLLDGVLSDIESSDDSYIHTRSGFGQTLVDLHNMEMIVSAETTVDSPTTLDLTIESSIDEPSGLAQIRMRNWNTNQFESIGSYSIGNTDQVDTINNIDVTDYIDGSGNIDLSIKHLVFVPFLAFTFESFLDHVEIVVN